MSDFSLTLVLQNQDKQNHQWHGKSTNKIRESHSFWRNIFCFGQIRLYSVLWVHFRDCPLSHQKYINMLNEEQRLQLSNLMIFLNYLA